MCFYPISILQTHFNLVSCFISVSVESFHHFLFFRYFLLLGIGHPLNTVVMSSLDKTSAVHTVKPECIGGEFKSSKPALSSIALERSRPLVSTRKKSISKSNFNELQLRFHELKNFDSLILMNQLLVN